MTDPTNTPSNPEELTTPAASAASEPVAPAAPVAPEAPAAPQAPAAPAANPYAAPAAAPAGGYAAAAPVKQGLSLTSFILGLIGVVFSFVYGIGFLPGLAAVILGFLGKKREPQAPKWMWLTGIITGFVSIAIGLIVFIIVVIVAILWAAAIGSTTYVG